MIFGDSAAARWFLFLLYDTNDAIDAAERSGNDLISN